MRDLPGVLPGRKRFRAAALRRLRRPRRPASPATVPARASGVARHRAPTSASMRCRAKSQNVKEQEQTPPPEAAPGTAFDSAGVWFTVQPYENNSSRLPCPFPLFGLRRNNPNDHSVRSESRTRSDDRQTQSQSKSAEQDQADSCLGIRQAEIH